MRSQARMICRIVVAFAAVMSGCAVGPWASRDSLPVVLGAVPVAAVLVLPGEGVSTALVLPRGRVLMSSHALPRGRAEGDLALAGHTATYRVLASGDGLNEQWGRRQAGSAPMPGTDWALLAIDPPGVTTAIAAGPIVHPTPAVEPPRVGETVYLVGYTMEGEWAVRRIVPVTFVHAPARLASLGGDVVWFRVLGGSLLGRGLSGAPLIRVREGGVVEVCGMMVAAAFLDRAGGEATDLGVAIPVPVFD